MVFTFPELTCSFTAIWRLIVHRVKAQVVYIVCFCTHVGIYKEIGIVVWFPVKHTLRCWDLHAGHVLGNSLGNNGRKAGKGKETSWTMQMKVRSVCQSFREKPNLGAAVLFAWGCFPEKDCALSSPLKVNTSDTWWTESLGSAARTPKVHQEVLCARWTAPSRCRGDGLKLVSTSIYIGYVTLGK